MVEVVKFNCDYCLKLSQREAIEQFKQSEKHFCSKKCHNASMRKGGYRECVICRLFFYTQFSNFHRKSTCSRICTGLNKKGRKNSNWRGGTTNERSLDMASKEYKEWRRSVFERDNYTCQFCLKRGGYIQADHIKPWAFYPDLRHDIENGRTLCLDCHMKTFKDLSKHRKLTEKGLQ